MNRRARILVVFGTRPEAIKMAPVVLKLRHYPDIDCEVCVTAQHRELLDEVTEFFGIRPRYDLDIMRSIQTPSSVSAEVLRRLPAVFEDFNPDCVLVHGDTTTTLAASLAAFHARIPVGHVEAGLRTGDLTAPWPEEMNRVVTARLASWNFAPTVRAAENLIAEGVPESRILVTGNTVIDAVHLAVQCMEPRPVPADDRYLVLVTAHRRENFGCRMERIAEAVARIAGFPQARVVVSVHPNPEAKGPMVNRLANVERVELIDPPSYPEFLHLLQQAELIISDSGGIQEEAAALGKPVLLLRDKTERPEGVEAGISTLVGADVERIVTEAELFWRRGRKEMDWDAVRDTYGNGTAAEQISEFLRRELSF